MKKLMAGCGLSFAFLLGLCAFGGRGWAQTGAQNGVQSGAASAAAKLSPAAATAVVSQGLAALQANHPRQALTDFQGVLQSDPNNTAANLLASTAAVETFQGQLAVQYAEKARQLDPGNWKIHTTLVAAYSAAGMKQQRDRERALLEQLHKTGAPDARQATGFLLEMFPLNAYRVDAIEYFEPMGKFHTYYRLLVRQANGHRIWEVDVQSNDFDERSWAEAHGTEAAAGERQFQITGRGSDSQEVDYRMFSGRPDYDNIRVMVVEILRSRPIPGGS
jgi:tetratricopeptide (TPR) repeat protein